MSAVQAERARHEAHLAMGAALGILEWLRMPMALLRAEPEELASPCVVYLGLSSCPG
jgi:hypothetical protein